MVTRKSSRSASAEQRLKELGIKLPEPPEPFGIYSEAVRTGNLLFLTGMLPTEGREAKIVGRVGAELDVETARKAARIAALNVLAVARQQLGSLDKVTRVVRLGVSVATSGDVRDQPKVADAASELLQDISEKRRTRVVWFMEWQAFHSELRSSWKLFSKSRVDERLRRATNYRSANRFGIVRVFASIGGASPRKGRFRGTPNFLSHETD